VPDIPQGLRPGGRAAAWAADAPAYVALDVDGTLLAGTPRPSAPVLAALRALVDDGAAVGVATGRMPSAVAPLLAAAALPGPHVVHNGAAVVAGDGRVLAAWTLTDDEVATLLELGHGRDDLLVEVYAADAYRVGRLDPRSAAHTALLGVGPVGTIAAPSDLGAPAVKAVVLAFTPEAERDTVDLAHRLGLAPGPASAPSVPGVRFINVTHGATDKAGGIAAAAASLGVGAERVAVVGDETNDLPALAFAGTAIAMGDTAAEVRAAAHLVAPPFDADGAAVALDALRRLRGGG
jgi:hydroxymethylpyrimidine pyrophosphatase-like HAD family hydrolase